MYIDLEKAKKEFIEYTKNFDLNDPMIDLKITHSLRVMEVANLIARKMNLNEEDIEIATIIGLLHDIARFEQYTKYKTYHDLDSFDHGDYGVKILDTDIRKYIQTDKYDSLIKIAIKNHNKFEIEDGLTQKELFFCKLIRDADKLDILYQATYLYWKNDINKVNNSDIDSNILDTFYKKTLIKRRKGINYEMMNSVLITIAYSFDIYFKESFEILKQKDYINRILDRFNYKNIEIYSKIRNFINNYIKEKVE